MHHTISYLVTDVFSDVWLVGCTAG